ncbi:MAG TPA: YfbM family protein [Micropepsaceae bacterium]|nr:YfbM family protein [Micropepsaceae bacterium]
MSMMARFVAVTPKRLEKMRKSPEEIEALFAANVAPPSQAKFREALLARIRHQAPEALRASLNGLPPEMRAQFLRNFGMNESDLAKPDVGEILVKRFAERVAKQMPDVEQTGERDAPGRSISLEKAWHGLHYLLSGSAEPVPGAVGQAVFGGTEIGDDLGYGPARCFTVAETSDIAQALQAPGLENVLRKRFDANAMQQLGIYPGGVWDEGPDWLIDAFRTLRDFYAGASAAGQAVVTAIE